MSDTIINPLTQQPLSDEDLGSIASLARKQYVLETKIASIEEELKLLSAELLNVSTNQIPNRMIELGLDQFTLSNGYKLTIKPVYAGSIPPADGKNADPVRRERCFKWLRDNNFGSLIKTEVSVLAGKGDEALVEKTKRALEDAEIPYCQQDSVHHMTLKSFIREQCELALPPPVELFRTFQGKQAVITKK